MKKTLSSISAALVALPLVATAAFAAPPDVDTAVGIDPARGCVYNGFDYKPPSGNIAQGDHCYTTPDNSTRPRVGAVNASKTLADLKAVEKWSPLDPAHYLAKDTMATRGIPADAPRAANSTAIATFVSDELPRKYLPDNFDPWLRLGANIGGGVAAHDNIPIYTVDSTNPHQTFQKFATNDPRVTTFAKLTEMTTGSLPLPTWAKPSDGGDHAFAIYDVGTGIWRSYLHAVKDASGTWNFASAGYWYGDKNTRVAGEWNYWLGLIQGGSSVVGLSNELTQVGAQEVKNGQINHMVSFTFPSTKAGVASFPAKQTDGRLDAATYPNAPEAGQVFTFPVNFDVEAYVKANNIDATTASLMRAVKKYGGIITDQNAFVMAVNFENPYGMGVRGDNPNANPWRDDPVLAQKVNSMNLNKFPWAKTEWLAPDYAGHGSTTPPPTPTPTVKPLHVLGQDAAGTLWGYQGTGKGTFAPGRVKISSGTSSYVKSFSVTGFSAPGRLDYIGMKQDGSLWLRPGRADQTLGAERKIGTGWGMFNLIIGTADFSGDGKPDVIARKPDGSLYLYKGNGAGGWASGAVKIGVGWQKFNQIVAVGDFSGDKKNDLLARTPAGDLYLYKGNRAGGWASGAVKIGRGWQVFNTIIGPGDFTGDGKVDVMARKPDGSLYLYKGNGASGWASGAVKIGAGWQMYSKLVGRV